MLIDIRRYIKERKTVSMKDVCIHFDTNVEAVKPILDILIKKGYIKEISSASCASCTGSCAGCGTKDDLVNYVWIETK